MTATAAPEANATALADGSQPGATPAAPNPTPVDPVSNASNSPASGGESGQPPSLADLKALLREGGSGKPAPAAAPETPEDAGTEAENNAAAADADAASGKQGDEPGATPGDDPLAPTDDATPSAQADDGPKRLRLNRDRWKGREGDFAAIQLSDKLGITLDEAKARLAEQYGGKPAAKASDADPQPGATPAADAAQATPEANAPTIESLEAEIAALDAQADEAAENLDGKAQRAAEKAMRAKEKQLEELKRQQSTTQQSRAQEFESALTASMGTVAKDFPDAFTEGSPFESAVVAEVERLQKAGSPIFNDPNWPEYVIPSVAARKGFQKAAPAAPKPAASVPATSAQPAPTPPKSAARAVTVPPKPAAPAPAPGSRGPGPGNAAPPSGAPLTLPELKAALREAEAVGAAGGGRRR